MMTRVSPGSPNTSMSPSTPAVKPVSGIESAHQRESHPDTGKQGQDDLLGPDGEYDGDDRWQYGIPAWIGHLGFSCFELRGQST